MSHPLFDVANLLACSFRQVTQWLRLYRNARLDALCTSMYYKSLVILKPSFSISKTESSFSFIKSMIALMSFSSTVRSPS